MSGQRNIFDQAMSRGHSAAWDLQWDRAIACYRAALTEFPDDPNALTSLGFALLQADKIEDALKMYQRAAMLAQGDPVAPEKCGEIYEQLGRLNEAAQTYLAVAEIYLTRRDVEKAIANWSRVVRITPDNLAAHSRLALAFERSGKPRQAVQEYLEVARLFQRANDNEKALQAATRAQQLEPSSLEARNALDKLRRGLALPVPERPKGTTGTLRVMTGPLRLPDAPPSADQQKAAAALSAKGASPLAVAKEVALAQLAEVLFDVDTDTSKTSGSMTAISKGTGQIRGNQAKRAQAIMYLGQAINNQSSNNVEAAVNNYEQAVNAGLDHPMVNFALGTLYLDLNRSSDAIKYLRMLVAHKDVGMGALFGLGQAYYQDGKTREALVSLLEALKRLDVELVPPERQEGLAETYETISESLLHSSEADRVKLIEGLAKFLSGDGWEERARQARQQLDAAEDGQTTPLADMLATPGSDQVLESLRRIEEYIGKRYWTTALEEAYYALQFSPTHLPIHIRIAEILVAQQKQEAAIGKYAAIAETYHIRGETMRAARIMQQVLRLSPLDVKMRSKLIELLMEQGHSEEALNQYLDLADTYYQLADLESARTTYAQALDLAQKAAADRTWSVRILHAIGDIDLQRLAWREALRVYQQVKTLAANDAKANVTLIDLYFRLGNAKQAVVELDDYLRQLLGSGKAVQAINLLEELVGNQPRERALIARLGRLYQDQGRKAEAIAQYDRLGEMQLEAGEKTQAAETIRTIITLGPENPAGYQQLLAQLQS